MAQMALHPIKHTIHAADDPDCTERHALLTYALTMGDTLHIRAACPDGPAIDGVFRVMRMDDYPAAEALCLLLPAVTMPGYPSIVAVVVADISFVQHRKMTAGHDSE